MNMFIYTYIQINIYIYIYIYIYTYIEWLRAHLGRPRLLGHALKRAKERPARQRPLLPRNPVHRLYEAVYQS